MTGEGAEGRPEAEAAEELRLLFPDADVALTDPETGAPVRLTVREFRFREGLEAQALARPLIDALADGIEGELLGADAIADALAEHADLWMELCARASGTTTAWLAGLSDEDGDALSDAMWGANGGFFTRRVVATVAARIRKRTAAPTPPDEQAEAGSRSPRSSTPSSAPDTGGDTGT